MSANGDSHTWEEAVLSLRGQPDKRQLVLDAFYDDPLIEAAERFFRSAEWAEVRHHLSGRTGKALDIGAGRGIASYALAKEGFEVTALEPDPSNVVGAGAIRNLAETADLPIQVVQEFSEKLPFSTGSMDVVFARAVLHHMRDLPAACGEIFRVLKPGGLFIAVREHVVSRREDLPKFLDAHPLHHLYGGEHAFLLDEYLNAIRGAGFGKVDVLSPLTSAVNLYPHSFEDVRNKIADRLPLPRVWRALLSSNSVLKLLLSAAERFDNRPGRLYSFVAAKAGTSS